MTTPVRRRGSSPRPPAGRCSPSRPAAPAPAPTRCAATACCSTPTSAAASSGSSSSATRPCPARSSGCWLAPTSRCWPPWRRGSGASGRSRRTRDRAADAPRPTTPPGSSSGRRPTARSRPARPAARRRARPHAVRRRSGAVSRALPPEGLLVVGASSPIRDLDLMARPYEVGERRKVIANRGLSGIDGTVSTAIGAALGRADSSRALALMGDVTFLHDSNGLVLGPDRAATRPDDRGRQRRRRLDLLHARAGRASSTPTASTRSSARRTASTSPASAPPPAPRTGWPAACAELEQALANPNGGIEVVEVRVRRDNRRELDARIRALRP